MLTEVFDRWSTMPAPGQRRAMGLNLVIYFLFALVAVALLTRTAVAANAINRDLRSAIVPVTGEIDGDLKKLPVLDKTGEITVKIAAAAKPLGGDVSSIRRHTDTIEGNFVSTDKHVLSIGKSVDSIKASTGSIKPGIEHINSTLDVINGQATGINERLGTVSALTTSIFSSLSGAATSLRTVLDAAGPIYNNVLAILVTARSIQGHTASIASSDLLSSPDALTALLKRLAPGSTPAPAPTAAAKSVPAPTTAAPKSIVPSLPELLNDPVKQILPLLGNLLGGL